MASETTVIVKNNLHFDGSAESHIKNLIDQNFDSIQLCDLVANVPDPEVGGETAYLATVIGVKTESE